MAITNYQNLAAVLYEARLETLYADGLTAGQRTFMRDGIDLVEKVLIRSLGQRAAFKADLFKKAAAIAAREVRITIVCDNLDTDPRSDETPDWEIGERVEWFYEFADEMMERGQWLDYNLSETRSSGQAGFAAVFLVRVRR